MPAAQSSPYRGVSLLRRTGRWHAQINFEGRQVHLGFYPAEIQAAAAYDRAALVKWFAAQRAVEAPTPPRLNFEMCSYAAEHPALARVSPGSLVAALGNEQLRRGVMASLAHGFKPQEANLSLPCPALKPLNKRAASPSPPLSDAPVTPPASIAIIARQRRRKLAVPLHGPSL